MRTLGKIAIAPSIAAGLVAATGGIANAGVLGGYTTNGVYIRSGPSTSYGAYGAGYRSQSACIYYLVNGQTINGDPYWDNNKDLSTGVRGDSADAYMYSSPGHSC